jgi:hypothetical protein
MSERAPPLDERGGAKRRMEGLHWREDTGIRRYRKKRREIWPESTRASFPFASEKGVSDDISFFVFPKL